MKRSLDIDVDLCNIDKELAKRILAPSSVRVDNMIDSKDEIDGVSVFHFYPRDVTTTKINGLQIHIPADEDAAIDMIGMYVLYLSILREEHNHLLGQFKSLFFGLKRNKRQLKKYFQAGGTQFGFFLFAKLHNATTSYLRECYDHVPIEEATIDFIKIIVAIKQREYPVLKEISHHSRTNQSRPGSSGGGNSSFRTGNQSTAPSNPSTNPSKQKTSQMRGSGNGLFVSTMPGGGLFGFPKKLVNRTNDPPIPTNSNGTRICFNAILFKDCGNQNCKFSHEIAENANKIDNWAKGNNLPIKKRE